MKLIVTLGNPEAKYTGTRHNAGWELIDAYAKEKGIDFRDKTKFKGLVAELPDAILLKPTTYYNLSGEAARSIADFYHIPPEDILVVHDDLALPLGTVRTRIGGSDAGNNGVKSITQHLGDGTARLRVGTWSEQRDQMDDVAFVLGKFSADEQKILSDLTSVVTSIIDDFIGGTFATTSHRLTTD